MPSSAVTTPPAAGAPEIARRANWWLVVSMAMVALELILQPVAPTHGSVPYQLSTAIMMWVSALSLRCLDLGRRHLALILIAPVFLSVTATFASWVAGADPPLGVRLFSVIEQPHAWFPPRVAVEAALAMAFLACALVLLALPTPLINATAFAWATGIALIVTPPLRSGIYAVLAPDLNAWLANARTEALLSVALMTMGMALVEARSTRTAPRLDLGARWRALLLLAAAAATITLWYSVRAAEVRQLRLDVGFALDEATRSMRVGLQHNAAATERLWQHWRSLEWRVSDAVFLQDAAALLSQEPQILGAGMLDANGRTLRFARRGVPFAQRGEIGDPIVLAERDAFNAVASDEQRAAMLRQAFATRTRVRSKPISVEDGATVAYAITPVYDGSNAPLGGFILIYRRDLTIERLLAEVAPDFHIRVIADEQVVFDRAARDGADSRASRFRVVQTRTFSSPLTYTFEIEPGPKIIDRALGWTPLLVLIFAWASLLLLLYVLYSERRARTLFQERERILNQSSDLICTLREDGAIVTANDAAERILGLPAQQLIGRSLFDFVAPAQRDATEREWLQTPTQTRDRMHALQSRPTAFLRTDGKRIFLQSLARWSEPERLLYCSMRDVTVEHELHLQRQHAEDTFSIGIAQAGCAVYEFQLQPNGIGFIHWVGATRSLAGYEADELSARGFAGWMELVHPDDAAHVRRVLERCIETRQAHTVDYRLRRKDGSYVPVLDRGRPLADAEVGAERMVGALIDLTAIRQQEIALRRSEERYRIIASQVGAVIIERETATGRIRVFGPAEHIFGYTREQMEARPLDRNDTMIHPDDRAHYFAAVEQAERTLSSYYVEHRRRHRGGHYIYIASRGVVLPGADGKAEREVIAITDISERKQAEARLQESEERFRLAAEQAGQIVYEFRLGEQLKIEELRFAGATEQVLGFSARELREAQGEDRFALIHPDDVEMVRSLLARDGANHYTVEHRVRHRDGHFVYVENRGAIKRGQQGEVIGVVGMLLDITARRAAERERQRYTSQLRALADLAHKVGSVLSVNELLRMLAESMRELLGANAASALVADPQLAPEHIVAVSYAEHYGPQRGAPSALGSTELHAQLRAADRPLRLTVEQMAEDPALAALTQHDDLRHPLRGWLAAPMTGRNGAHLGVLELSDKVEGDFSDSDMQVLDQLAGLASVALENIRLYATLEERVAARTRELEISNRELEAFSYSVSHDLRAPLRAIAGFSSILESEYAASLDKEARRYLQRITGGVERMANLIDDLLSLARVSRADLRREPVDVTALSRAIVKRLLERYIERKIEVSVDERMKTTADPRLVEVALENLIENAFKFTGTRAQAIVRVGQRRVDGRTVFFVSDNGVGFDPKYASNLFGVFQRLHSISDFPGTGVGLATVQRIVQRHQGRIWAEAEADRGATFYFTFAADA